MRKASSFQIALAIAFRLCTTPLCAQLETTSSSPDTNYTKTHLNAVVVSSTDGKPVPRVLVTSPDRRMATITDSEGRFSFDLRRTGSQAESHVFSSFPPNPAPAVTTIPVHFVVRSPGYITGNVTLHLPAIPPTEPEPTLQLKIVPAAVLTGHLYPDAGDLPANLSVELRRKQVQNGVATWEPTSTAPVNSRGEFRFANLQPSDYKLVAPGSSSFPPLTQPLPDSIRGFRPAFYPNASSLDAATPIHLNSGETATANFAYHSATFYSVTIPVAGPTNPAVFDVRMPADIPGLSFTHDGQSAHAYLPSGDYNIQLTTAPTSTALALVASVHLQVEPKAVRTQPAAFHPTFELPVIIQRESTKPATDTSQTIGPPAVYFGMQALGSFVGLQTAVLTKPGAITIQNLFEGLYRVDITTPTNGSYVASATSGTTDLLREPLQVLPGVVPRPIEVVLRDDPANLTLRVPPNLNQPSADDSPIFLLCIQLDRTQAQPFPFVVRQNNQVPTTTVPPGRYLVLASRQDLMQTIEFRNPDVLRDLLPKGSTITLSPNQKADLEVRLMPDGAN